MSTRRFMPGIGSGDYVPIEDELARDLIAAGKHDEVKLLHGLKANLDAAAVETDDSWHRERQKLADRQTATRQEALL